MADLAMKKLWPVATVLYFLFWSVCASIDNTFVTILVSIISAFLSQVVVSFLPDGLFDFGGCAPDVKKEEDSTAVESQKDDVANSESFYDKPLPPEPPMGDSDSDNEDREDSNGHATTSQGKPQPSFTEEDQSSFEKQLDKDPSPIGVEETIEQASNSGQESSPYSAASDSDDKLKNIEDQIEQSVFHSQQEATPKSDAYTEEQFEQPEVSNREFGSGSPKVQDEFQDEVEQHDHCHEKTAEIVSTNVEAQESSHFQASEDLVAPEQVVDDIKYHTQEHSMPVQESIQDFNVAESQASNIEEPIEQEAFQSVEAASSVEAAPSVEAASAPQEIMQDVEEHIEQRSFAGQETTPSYETTKENVEQDISKFVEATPAFEKLADNAEDKIEEYSSHHQKTMPPSETPNLYPSEEEQQESKLFHSKKVIPSEQIADSFEDKVEQQSFQTQEAAPSHEKKPKSFMSDVGQKSSDQHVFQTQEETIEPPTSASSNLSEMEHIEKISAPVQEAAYEQEDSENYPSAEKQIDQLIPHDQESSHTIDNFSKDVAISNQDAEDRFEDKQYRDESPKLVEALSDNSPDFSENIQSDGNKSLVDSTTEGIHDIAFSSPALAAHQIVSGDVENVTKDTEQSKPMSTQDILDISHPEDPLKAQESTFLTEVNPPSPHDTPDHQETRDYLELSKSMDSEFTKESVQSTAEKEAHLDLDKLSPQITSNVSEGLQGVTDHSTSKSEEKISDELEHKEDDSFGFETIQKPEIAEEGNNSFLFEAKKVTEEMGEFSKDLIGGISSALVGDDFAKDDTAQNEPLSAQSAESPVPSLGEAKDSQAKTEHKDLASLDLLDYAASSSNSSGDEAKLAQAREDNPSPSETAKPRLSLIEDDNDDVEEEDPELDLLESKRAAFDTKAKMDDGDFWNQSPKEPTAETLLGSGGGGGHLDGGGDDISHRAIFGDDEDPDEAGLEEEEAKESVGPSEPEGQEGHKEEFPEVAPELTNRSNVSPDHKETIDIDLKDPQVQEAAVKIQAAFKGFKTRKSKPDLLQ